MFGNISLVRHTPDVPSARKQAHFQGASCAKRPMKNFHFFQKGGKSNQTGRGAASMGRGRGYGGKQTGGGPRLGVPVNREGIQTKKSARRCYVRRYVFCHCDKKLRNPSGILFIWAQISMWDAHRFCMKPTNPPPTFSVLTDPRAKGKIERQSLSPNSWP